MSTRWLIFRELDGYEIVFSLYKKRVWRPINATPDTMREYHGSPVCIVREKPAPVALPRWDARGAH